MLYVIEKWKTTTNEYIPKRRNRIMANQSSGEMPPPLPGNGTTVMTTVSETMPSTVGSTPAVTLT